MSKKITTTYYCDRCGEEILFKRIKPTFYYIVADTSWINYYYGKEKKRELCDECGKKLERFFAGAELVD